MNTAPYFSHNMNARNDERIIALRMAHGWEGYGVFWAIVEKLAESTNYKLSVNFNSLAFDLRASNELIKSIVTGFGLFTIEHDTFYSKSLCDRMLLKGKKSESAKIGANARWGKNATISDSHSSSAANAMQTHRATDANALQTDGKSDANKVKKESKESKEKKESNAPAGAGALSEHSSSKGPPEPQNSTGQASHNTVVDTTPLAEIKEEGDPSTGGNTLIMPWLTPSFGGVWTRWKAYQKEQHRFAYKGVNSEQAALKLLCDLSNGREDIALKIIERSIAYAWRGFFALDKNNHDNGNATAHTSSKSGNGDGSFVHNAAHAADLERRVAEFTSRNPG